jgi:hypothetical protein
MRNRRWIGALCLLVGGLCVLWTSMTRPIDDPRHGIRPIVPLPRNPGQVEESEPIEPLVVEGAWTPMPATTVDEGPLPLVTLEPGMVQPPRPDGDRRMPEAD